MSRTRTLRTTYSHYPGQLVGAWSTPAFLFFKFARLGQRAIRAESRIERNTAGRFTVIDSHYRVPALRAGRLTRSGSLFMEVRQRDIWPEPEADGARDGVWQLRVRGLPVALGGVLQLRPRPPGPGAELMVRVTADARRLPVLGPLLERFATWMVRQTLDRVPAITQAWLSGGLQTAPDAPDGQRPEGKGVADVLAPPHEGRDALRT